MIRSVLVAVSTVALVSGVSCFIGFTLIGSEVRPDGLVVEPFALLPLGWLGVFVAGGAFAASRFMPRAARA